MLCFMSAWFGFMSSLRMVGGHIVFGMDSVCVSVEVAFCLHSNLLSYMYGRPQTIL